MELPEVGSEMEATKLLGVVASVKAKAGRVLRVGTVVEVNEALNDAPGTVNESPFESGWLMKGQGFRRPELVDGRRSVREEYRVNAPSRKSYIYYSKYYYLIAERYYLISREEERQRENFSKKKKKKKKKKRVLY